MDHYSNIVNVNIEQKNPLSDHPNMLIDCNSKNLLGEQLEKKQTATMTAATKFYSTNNDYLSAATPASLDTEYDKYLSAVTATPFSMQASAAVTGVLPIVNGKLTQKRESLACILLPTSSFLRKSTQDTTENNESCLPNCNSPHHLQNKAAVYSQQFFRSLKFLDVLVVVALFLFITFVFFICGVDLLAPRSVLYLLLVWFFVSGYYLCIPTFKRWFFYWDPDFSFRHPS